jgi:hypothetical protein
VPEAREGDVSKAAAPQARQFNTGTMRVAGCLGAWLPMPGRIARGRGWKKHRKLQGLTGTKQCPTGRADPQVIYMDRILRYRATSGPIANAIAAMTTIETPVAM